VLLGGAEQLASQKAKGKSRMRACRLTEPRGCIGYDKRCKALMTKPCTLPFWVEKIDVRGVIIAVHAKLL